MDSMVCAGVGMDVNEWFLFGLRQGCLMSPWLFTAYMDGVVREANARVLGRGLDGDGGFEIKQLLICR